MDPILKVIMEDEPVSTTPREVFQQADELFQQAAALRKDANDLQERVRFMYDRADTFTTTAQGLQEIAFQDRNAMQERWDHGLRESTEDLTIYVSDPENAARFKEMQSRIEDGMVNARDMAVFVNDVDDFLDSRRAQRSATPEPETPAMSEEPSLLENLMKSHWVRSRALKRQMSADDGARAVEYDMGRDATRMKPGQQSDEDTFVNDAATRLESNGHEGRRIDGEEATTEVEECSSQKSQSTKEEDSDQRQVEAISTDSSDEDGSISSTSNDTHTTDEACEQFDNPSIVSDDQGSESGESSATDSTTASSSSAGSIDTVVVQKDKAHPEQSSKTTKERTIMEVAPQRAGDRNGKRRTAGEVRVTDATDRENKTPKIRPATFWIKQGYTWDQHRQMWLRRGRL